MTWGIKYYNVRPRYTCGSPAIVDAQTAARVARQEKEGFETALSGIYGPEEQARAGRDGLRGIAEAVLKEHRQNRRDGFIVRDLITGEEYWRPQRTGNGDPTEPDCLVDTDHQLDPATLQLTADGDNNVVIVGRCSLCSRKAASRPVIMFFEDR